MIRKLFALLVLCVAGAAGIAALAQPGYPGRPIRLVVPFPPAGATDVVSRLIADRISANNPGWTIVVENKPGAGGNIGLESAARSKPDGYTIAMGQTANLAINPALYATMPYDALKDFVPVALVAEQPLVVVVNADSPYKSLADLVAAAKSKSLNMASAGNGTVGHLAGELFARRAGFRITHVPYKGAAAALTDLMGGRVDFMMPTPQAALALVKGGKLRALAVTSLRRVDAIADVPTIAESGYPDFVAIDWKGLVAPAGTPADIVERLHFEVERVLKARETIEKMAAEGSSPMRGSPAEVARFIRAEHARWGTVVREANVKLD
jgi:tripartite-type tricarboxylate transporter receptor subunit TctC